MLSCRPGSLTDKLDRDGEEEGGGHTTYVGRQDNYDKTDDKRSSDCKSASTLEMGTVGEPLNGIENCTIFPAIFINLGNKSSSRIIKH